MTTSEEKDRLEAPDAQQTPVTTLADVRRRYPGFFESHTGGGQLALRHGCDCGGHLLITGDTGHLPPDDALEVDIGRYGSRGDYIDGRRICVDEIVSWIDDALERSRNPKCIEDYFVRKLGWSAAQESLRDLSLASPAALNCVQAIDACAVVLARVQTAICVQRRSFWSAWFQSANPELEVIKIARGLVRAYRYSCQ